MRAWNVVPDRFGPPTPDEWTLTKLALNDDELIMALTGSDAANLEASGLDARAHALVRIGALLALDAAPPAYASVVRLAERAGVSAPEIVGVLVAVAPCIGTARAVSAAPELALAMGFDVNDVIERTRDRSDLARRPTDRECDTDESTEERYAAAAARWRFVVGAAARKGTDVSTDDPTGRRKRVNLRTARMEAFSDGVFAIAITLLVLDLVAPSVTEGSVGRLLIDQWPTYLAYLVSFASIGAAWFSHSTITEYLDRADSVLLRLNLLLLLFVSVLPFPTRMLGEYLRETGAERIAVTVYGLNLLAISGLTSVLWHYAVSERLTKGDLADDDARAITSKLNPSLAFYGVTIAIGLLVPVAAVVLYFAIALYLLIPFRAIARQLRRRPAG